MKNNKKIKYCKKIKIMESNNYDKNYKNLKLITIVKITNYPSKLMVIKLLNNFLAEKNYPKDYIILERAIFLEIKFKDSDIAYSFIKRLNYEKFINKTYSLIEVSMNVDIDKRKSYNKINKSSSVPRLYKINKTEKSEYSKRYEKPINQKSKFSEIAYQSILASTPYIDPYEEQKIKNRENKFKWISNKNFYAYFGRATSNKNFFYHDFINEGLPSNHLSFRPVEKNKWISKQNFLVC